MVGLYNHMYFIFALKQRKGQSLRKVFVSDMYIDRQCKIQFSRSFERYFQKNSLHTKLSQFEQYTGTCMSFPFSSFCIIIFSLSLIIIFLTICAILVFGILCFVFVVGFVFFSPSLLCVPYFTPRLFLSLSVTEIFSCDKKKILRTQRYKDHQKLHSTNQAFINRQFRSFIYQNNEKTAFWTGRKLVLNSLS